MAAGISGWVLCVGALVAVVLLLIVFVIGLYNSLVQLRNRVKNAWSQIEVQLQQRNDLIPNLVETVKGYASHESGTFERVIQARNAAMAATSPAEAAEADNMLTGALRQLFALAEAYPDLKANTNFLQLQEKLGVLEEKISFARMFYNDTVMIYNTKIQQFPAVVIAGMLGFTPEELFKSVEGAETPPVVSFE